ncbi:MAG: hypothetical protein Q4G27_02805 [Flavobacteriaceae bacterium]|nr:hypothetical protein [Flavobacteriaceae bacterium]
MRVVLLLFKAQNQKVINNQTKPLQSLCCRGFPLFFAPSFPVALSACIWAVFERAKNPKNQSKKQQKKKKKSPEKSKIRTADRTDPKEPKNNR